MQPYLDTGDVLANVVPPGILDLELCLSTPLEFPCSKRRACLDSLRDREHTEAREAMWLAHCRSRPEGRTSEVCEFIIVVSRLFSSELSSSCTRGVRARRPADKQARDGELSNCH